MGWEIINSRLEDWSRSYSGPKFHAVLCDPPYGLEFMGKQWDEQVEAKAWGEALMPHLYPGALVLMFGGTRTWHHLATGMEQAGFEMWDTLMWLYGQGFPKAQKIDVDGFEGHKTCALKPAWEPILCFKKPLDGTYAECAKKYGSGALNVDGGRIPTGADDDPRLGGKGDWGTGAMAKNVYEGGYAGDRVGSSPLGRYPANLILDEESALMLDEQTGTLASGKPMGIKAGGQLNCYGVYGGVPVTGFGDSGGASRFFYVAKADSDERNAGLRGFEQKVKSADYRQPTGNAMVDRIHGCGIPKANHHPTVKPISLAKYLATLILPAPSVSPRRLLIPFSGSGSEMIGANQAGWDEIVGIEQDTEHGYIEIAKARVTYWESIGFQKDLFQVGGIDARAE